MINYSLPYGTSSLVFSIQNSIPLSIIKPDNVVPASNPTAEVRKALDHPLKNLRLDSFLNVKSVAIAINDKTRPVPHDILLPPLLQTLANMGVEAQSIALIIASGTHTPMTSDDFGKILPANIIRSYQVMAHNCDSNDLVFLGETAAKTPVYVNKKFYDADLRIVIGNIEPHHFMGFSGGVKSAAIGLAGRATININHSMLVDPNAVTGLYETNPMRMDVEEIGRLMKVQYALNTILNHDKKIVHVLAGDPLDVMKTGIALSRNVCQVKCKRRFDLVIASAGGHPKDINLYQAQKALTHAAMVTKDGGVIILVAACPEGSGSRDFEDYVRGVSTPDEVFKKFSRDGFCIGPHKAFQIARIVSKVKVILVSSISADLVKSFFMTHARNPEEAMEIAMGHFSSKPAIAILPQAVNTIPVIPNNKNFE